MKIKISIILLLIVNMTYGQLNINNYIMVGETRIEVGNYVGAIENFNIVIKFRPQLPEPYFFRGLAKHQLEDYRGAIDDYNKAIEIKPYYPSAYINRGLAYLQLHNYKNAISNYEKALEFSPHNAGIYNNLGIAKLSMKKIDDAIKDYDKALEIKPNFVNALINRSNAYIVKGDLTKGIYNLNKAIVIRPHYASAYLLRGLARFQMDDYASALRDFDQTIRFDPKNAYAYNNRGIVKQKLEDYSGAIMDYDLALRLNPTMANAYFNRGIAREVLKRPGYEQDYQIAARLNPHLDMQKRREADQQQYFAQNQSASSGNGGHQDSIQNSKNQKLKQEEKEKKERRFRLALADTRNIPGINDEEYDNGLVQNKDVIIELQNIFMLSYTEKNQRDYSSFQYYNRTIESINQYNDYSPTLIITDKIIDKISEIYENNISYFNDKIKKEKNSKNLLCRGIFKFLNSDLNGTIDDLNESIELNNKEVLAYFSRGNCRTKMVELLESVPDYSRNIKVPIGQSQSSVYSDETKPHSSEYNKILKDYQTCIDIDPTFPFSYYNQAYIYCKLDRYKDAISSLDKAIKLRSDFAEAYYNRGLTKIYLDDIKGGALDLSKAGELGIQEAYNVIKRYCN
ncbi:MAG: tetratricopeptide repeat protein [Prolixibacteraceae bacterium]|nr:tetratricopeptide repeat protein [Prolixibacteraceae bacterium]